MNIEPYDSCHLDSLKQFIAKCNYLPFSEYGVSRDQISDYVVGELSETVSSGGFVFVAKDSEETVGLIDLKKLEWDSAHFGIETAKIDYLLASGDYLKSLYTKQKLISRLMMECHDRLVSHMSIRVNKEDVSSIHALESKAFRLMDVLVTYSFDFRKQKLETATVYPVRFFKQSDLPRLIEISLECFGQAPVATDRFHADPFFSKEKSDRLYSEWLKNLSQDPSNVLLVAEDNGNPVGFNVCTDNKLSACKIGLRVGSMILTAVASSERNKLVGASLLTAAVSWFQDKVDIVESGGQVSNYRIQRAWSRVGFKQTRSQCTFHWSILLNGK
jgi:dTDP-4-amino-4,6-dideoxy-D-galactose acyltransferase